MSRHDIRVVQENHLHESTIDFLAYTINYILRCDPNDSNIIFSIVFATFEQKFIRIVVTFYNFLRTDFDEDGVLGLNDLERTCRQLVQDGLNTDEVATVCRKVLEESDIDGDGVLSYLEFEHVVTRASDFMATFHIRI